MSVRVADERRPAGKRLGAGKAMRWSGLTAALCALLPLLAVAFMPAPRGQGVFFEAEEIPRMQVAHHSAGVVACDGKLYVWSGYSDIPNARHRDRTPLMEIYDPQTGRWSRGADVPGKRNGAGAFELDGLIYSVGGEGEVSATFTRSVYRYDPARDKWTTLNDFPTRAWDPLSVVCEGKAYVFGGRHGYGPTYPYVYAYDRENDAWTRKASMLTAVRKAGVVAWGGKIYVFGGVYQITENEVERVQRIQVYDPATDTWDLDGAMPYQISDLHAVAHEGRIVLFAEFMLDEESGKWVPNRFVYVYDPKDKDWAQHAFSPPVKTAYGIDGCAIGGCVYFTDTFENGAKSHAAYRVRLGAR